MSKIHQPTRIEGIVHKWLEEMGIPHRMYPKVEGKPDVEILCGEDEPIYLFVDGCFWHCCPLHYKRPKSNVDYWIRHVEESNRKREARRASLPYRWLKIWEHDVQSGEFKQRIIRLLRARRKTVTPISFAPSGRTRGSGRLRPRPCLPRVI